MAKERARDIGIKIGPFETGKYNAITDVAGVKIGHTTLNFNEGKLVPGKGPVRTGVSVIIPADGDLWRQKLAAGSFVLNGNGEATGLMWLQESGVLETPIAFTNTLNVGKVQSAILQWILKQYPKIGVDDDTLTPLVLECDDSLLNDIRGMHVEEKHVFEALEKAKSGPVEEGVVGAGTGMRSYEFKAGIGTASRVLPKEKGGYTVGVILNANHGKRPDLRIHGLPPLHDVFQDIGKPKIYNDGSVVVFVATDAPLDSRQLSRLARRAMLGIARTGGIAYHGSGDVAVAFSTANRIPHYPNEATYQMTLLSDFWMDPLFAAAADATEEAILNSLFAAKDTTGINGNTYYAIPHDRVKQLLQQTRM